MDGDDEFARFTDARQQVAIPRATDLLADAEKLIAGNQFDDASPLLDEVESLGVLDERLAGLRARGATAAERVAEAERVAAADRAAEAERIADAERIAAAERAAEAERVAAAARAAAARAAAERIAEAERVADLERIAEAERVAVADRAEAERAEAERVTEAERVVEAARVAEAQVLAAQLERSGLLAYYAGDYADARVDLDRSISAAPTARAFLFLASSRVADGLLGSEDEAVWLTPAAEDYQRAVEAGVDPETYREFISPRILELLTDAPGR